MHKPMAMIIKCLIMLIISLWGIVPAAQAVDETKIPHYFGPYPNWALSPLPVVNTDGTISGGMRKFVDGLPRLGAAGANNLGQYLPVAVPDTTTYPGADYYEIGLVQYRQKMHSDLPASLLRGYVQLSTTVVPGQAVALTNALLDGTITPIAGYKGVTAPHYLGPIIVATKDRPVRVLFRNLLPIGSGGDLFLPVDSTMMGSGMGPMMMMAPEDQGTVTDMVRNPLCTMFPKSSGCFKDNRATLHLHGGVTPWISDGTPHQWITPANETTDWPNGVSMRNVPDMPDPGPGATTFFYTNQQSARLMFYHDHSWGITRLNVYAGEAAGYLITDDTEKSLINAGLIPGDADTIPLIVQDRTFVPPGDKTTRTGQLYEQDPTWDESRWGGFGNLWYHHVYMPAQNPGDEGGMSSFGRWMYGPWFWPPATPPYGPIANPYYSATCTIDDPATWQYQTEPYCEPTMIPGSPNISAGMEQFNDTPIVNGTAYPTVTLEPKTYRLRILNAANDRFFNFQWYVADSTGTEVALKAAELLAAQDDPVVFPTPDTSRSPVGPSWIQIGTEGGFLPAPVVIPNQHTTWITDPTRFDVGNVDQSSLLLAPAERADVIVDFSRFAGKTLILYNDAPAAFPARVPSYDYYTGAPDQSPVGAPAVLPGYGPNTRTVMQIKIANTTPANGFNLSALQTAFAHKADGSGVFESGQHPIIVGQAPYNSAYGTNFATSSWCNAPGSTSTRCDGLARISEQGGSLFGFNTLLAPTSKLQIPFEPKAIHDEMNAVAFDEFGRMMGNLGIETVPASPGTQNVTLYPFVNPATELIDATNLPKYGLDITPIATQDGSQIWKITHNGVDTHPIHFHLYDVQLINRVSWDNIISRPHAGELGWKDTVRVSPLQDTIVALRPVIPLLPFELPNSIRMQNPMMPAGSTAMFHNFDPQGNPTTPITNQLVNFGWEYMYHCHILSHEEMDMMRPVTVAVPPKQPDGLTFSLSGTGDIRNLVLAWNDNSISETAFLVQKTTNGATWTDIGTSPSPLNQPNTTGIRSLTDPALYNPNETVSYRVVAQNTIGYGAEFPSMTVTSASAPLTVGATPAAPTNLVATQTAATTVRLTWSDNSIDETGFLIQRSTSAAFTTVTTFLVAANLTSYDNTQVAATMYYYRVRAYNASGDSAFSNTATVTVTTTLPAPWQTRDIGSVGVAGSAGYLNGVFSVLGAGFDIWGTSDAFRYVYQPMTGDGQIIARVASIQNTNISAKAGIMMRETLANNSIYAMMVLSPAKAANFQRRLTTGATHISTTGAMVTAPYWVKLVRSGSTFSGFISSDGNTWVQVGSATINMATTIYVGLPVTSHDSTRLCTATFDGVTVTTGAVTPPTASITAPANGATFVAPATIPIAATATAGTGATITKVDFFNGTTLLGTATTSPYSYTWSNVPNGSYTLTARVTNSLGVTATSTPVAITVGTTPIGLPAPWAFRDIGSIGVPGGANFANNIFTVNGAGWDIWGTADSFGYAYRPWTGNGEIIARVASLQNTDPSAKAGIMMRETLTSGSIYAMMVLSPAKAANFQRRLTTGGTHTSTAGPLVTAPYWVRLVRNNNLFSGYISADGVTWTLVGSATITMANTIYVGLPVTSHNAALLCTSTFDGVVVQ